MTGTELFLGILPTDPRYELDDLIEHTFDLLKNDDKESVKDADAVFERLEISKDSPDKVQQLRKKVEERYIDERSTAVEAMEKGLTLDGMYLKVFFVPFVFACRLYLLHRHLSSTIRCRKRTGLLSVDAA